METTFRLRILYCFEVVAVLTLLFWLGGWLANWTWRYAGPIAIVSTIAMLTLYHRFWGLTWKNFGLAMPASRKERIKLIPQTLIALCAFVLAVLAVRFAETKLGVSFPDMDNSVVTHRFEAVRGSLPHYILWLIIVWMSAAFGEEMIFRGYLITRLSAAFNGFPAAPVLAVIISAAVFGYAHFHHQGLKGFILTGAIGLAFGTVFLLMGRKLLPVILVHGLIDTLGITALYFGLQ